jgi:APA family basic amino acid/polyamine antiporter
VPFLPLVSVAFCLWLMLALPLLTWIRFGAWLLIGAVIYFTYGVRHSRVRALGLQAAARSPQ